jgi:hypothetical protein
MVIMRELILLVFFGLLMFGCTAPAVGSVPDAVGNDTVGAEAIPDEVDSDSKEAEDSEEGNEDDPGSPGQGDGNKAPGSGETAIESASSEKTKVLLLGRSVAYHWTEYMGLEWTCDDENCATGSPRGEYDDYYFTYYELDYPPMIADSAAAGVNMYGQDAEIVFFKFCFVDFVPDHDMQNADDNIELTVDVYQEVVVEQGKKLIIGTALPKVSAHTEPALIGNHEKYNEWLEGFAASHDDIYVLDLNGMLADSDGSLMDDYQVNPEDSHLNSNGYARITPEFLDLLGRVDN